MKQTLRLQGKLCKKNICYIQLLLFASTLFTIVLVSCVCARAQVSASSQEAGPAAGAVTPTIQEGGLKIGDAIPEELWNFPLQVANHPEGKEIITLNDYKGKLIILDFWATWCSSCIAAMPKIDNVVRQFNNKLKVLPISYESVEQVGKFLKTNKNTKPLNLFSVVEDSLLTALFPHQTVPHYAWISPEGEIIATTSSTDITSGNINLILAGKEPIYSIKKQIDTSSPLFLKVDDMPKKSKIKGYALLTEGRVPDLPGGGQTRKAGNTTYGVSYFNKNLGGIYLSIARKIIPESSFKRFENTLEVSDNIGVSADMRNVRRGAPVYTVDFVVSPEQNDSLYHHLLDFLNQNLKYQCVIRKRKMHCLVLKQKNGDYQSIVSEKEFKWDNAEYKTKGYPMESFLRWLNRRSVSGDLIVLNETGYDGPVNIHTKAPFSDLDQLKKELEAQGLEIREANREIEMFVISKAERIPNNNH